MRPHQKALLLAAAVTLVGWAMPVVGQVLLPIQYLNTHIHELCHAVMAILTGGDVQQILVFSNGSGVTPVAGGALALVASAGYVGAAVGGALIILLSRHEGGAANTLRALAAILALSLVFWVRGDWVGVASGVFWVAALVGLSFLKGQTLIFAAQFIGLQQCLSSFRSLYTLVQISAIGEGHSDAGVMREATHVPAMVWSLIWCGISLALVTVSLSRAWRSPIRPSGSR